MRPLSGRVVFACLIGAGGLAVVAAPSARAQSAADAGARDAAIERLRDDTGGRSQVTLNPATGTARFVRVAAGAARGPRTAPGAAATPLAAQAASVSARQASADFLRSYGRAFGIRDYDADLRVVSEQADRLGYRHFTYQQMHRGVPVFAGILRSHVDSDQQVRAVNGTFVPGLDLDATPRRTAAFAAKRALDGIAAAKPEAKGLENRGTRLFVYREGLFKGVPGPNRLVWQVEVGNGRDAREFVFIDAHTAKWVDQITGIHEDLFRRAYDGQNLPIVPPEYPDSPFWVEGDPLPPPPTCVQDPLGPPCEEEANNMVISSKETYDLFDKAFGRDSFDAAGAIMDSIFDRGYSCPNASWNGVFISFCPGATTDDITAHEWGHAYTEYTHNLVYQWQPGALNESYSDIWGETLDLLNGRGMDTPGGPRSAASCTTFTSLAPEVAVNSPAAIAGPKFAAGASFGPQTFDVTGDVAVADDGVAPGTDACQPLVNGAEVLGKIALVDRGGCTFTTKVANAQAVGAIGVLVANNTVGIATMGGANPTIVIPSVMIQQADGAAIKAQIALPETVNVSLTGGAVGTDDSVRWLMGEDWTEIGGAIRDMWNPTCYANPGKVTDSAYYVCSTADQGGVHTNSGVPNHAYALLVDGGTYNGQTVGAIGLTKSAHIYFRAQSVYQSIGTGFAEHADALEQSCSDLIGQDLTDLLTGAPSGQSISALDCAQVSAAIAAVELRTPPTFCNFQPILDQNPPDRCEVGTDQVNIFLETFSTSPFRGPRTRRWTVEREAVVPGDFTPRDWSWVNHLPDSRPGTAMFAPDPNIGTCLPGGDESGVLRLTSPVIRLPEGATASRLTFDHWVATEGGWDGGNLEISVNGGPWTPIAFTDFTYNSYKFLLFSAAQGNTNPLAGLPAFTSTDGGTYDGGTWGRSHVELANYATGGDRFQLRFNLGTDGCAGRVGWYVDDVDVYACTPQTRPDILVSNISVVEGSNGGITPATFTVELSHAYSRPVFMLYRTRPGTALAFSDFQPRFGWLRIGPLDKTATVTVGVKHDFQPEPDENFFLKIMRAFNANRTGALGEAVIVDDDH